MKFLEKVITNLLDKKQDLSKIAMVLPGKRPVVFIKKILKEKKYEGFLPQFFAVDDLAKEISGKHALQGISLWLFAYQVYIQDQEESLDSFLKWFPTLLKDWDDMLKFSVGDKEILEYMLDDERIKNWGDNLGDGDNPRKRNLNFWRKMNVFLPKLKQSLEDKNWATDGMIHQSAIQNIENFVENTDIHFVFCGFNALTPFETKLIKKLLEKGKADCYFHADEYYLNDKKQEAGKFLREFQNWKEFNEKREFCWVENQFSQPKNINFYEVSGNVAQTKILPNILAGISQQDYSDTAVVLLDEELLPATLDAMSSVEKLNITMGFPIKNLGFSNAIKKLFHFYKQIHKKEKSYYYGDIFPVLEEFPKSENDEKIIEEFISDVETKNMVYISEKYFEEKLSNLSYFYLFQKKSAEHILDDLIKFCFDLKFRELDDILYENVSHFEKTFKLLKNHFQDYDFEISVEVLETLMNQLINLESIDFQGEPLQGLQLMGLLETRLLDFKNVIMLSVNEGKLPLGNTQNTYLPFDVRKNFGLNTFLENDSIYAYHFYRLLQNSKDVHLLFNALSSGVNTGEKSRFITQIEMESPHKIEHFVIENSSEPIQQEPITVEKTPAVLEKLSEWKTRVSASHLISYLYNPIDFYFNNLLKIREKEDIEEELSQRNYGNLVHYALDFLYNQIKGKILKINDLEMLKNQVNTSILFAIDKLKHQPELYEKGMNFIHKSIATKIVHEILDKDLELVKNGNQLEIIDLESNLQADFIINENEKITFNGFIDRIDRLNGVLRIIDYKTAKSKKLSLKPKEEKIPTLLYDEELKQALQLSIYAYIVLNSKKFPDNEIQCGIWSFSEVKNGVQPLEINQEKGLNSTNIETCMESIRNLILEILDPKIPFVEEKS